MALAITIVMSLVCSGAVYGAATIGMSGGFIFRDREVPYFRTKALVYMVSEAEIHDFSPRNVVLFYSTAIVHDKFDGFVLSICSDVYYGANPNAQIVEISPLVARLIVSALEIFACFVLFAIKRGFFAQGTAALIFEPANVARHGLVGYFIMLALGFICFASLVLIPATLMIAVLMYILTLLGQVSLALLTGFQIFKSLKHQAPVTVYLLVGMLIIQAFKMISLTGMYVTTLFIPLACTGIVATSLINGFLRKKFYENPFIA